MAGELLDLYLLFFRMGAVTFGGGYAMLPILRREIVQKRRWASGGNYSKNDTSKTEKIA